jgi:YfiH family protein
MTTELKNNNFNIVIDNNLIVKISFFGTNCIIDRNINDISNLELEINKQGFNYNNILFLNQIHSNKVITIKNNNQIYNLNKKPDGDCLVSNIKNISLAVFTADCLPILLFCSKRAIISAIHCGWRGLRGNIIGNAINAMKNLGATDINAYIGPHILQKSYQVSEDFYNDFISIDSNYQKLFIADQNEGGKFLFDLTEMAILQLREQKVESIVNIAIDSFSDGKFFSFRRAKLQSLADCGRNIAIINLQSI